MILITKCGTTAAICCLGAYYTDATLQSVNSSEHGGDIVPMVYLTQRGLGPQVSAYYNAVVVHNLATGTKHLVCATYILPTSF